MMIFENLRLLTQVGKYGNSNPHFIDDWVEATVDEASDKTATNPLWTEATSSCNFPSSYNV